MKICLLNNDFNSHTGSGRFCYELVRHLKRADAELDVRVLTVIPSDEPLVSVLLSANKFSTILNLKKIRACFADVDVIHALDGWPYGIIAALASLGLGKKIVITAIGSGAIQPLYRNSAPLLKWTYRRADKVVAISHYTRREILKRVSNVDVEVINHGVNMDEFSALGRSSGDEFRRTIEEIRPYILSVGAPKERKGFRYSLEAFAEIRHVFPHLRYLIVGPPDGYLSDVIARFNLGESVRFMHNLEPHVLANIYQNAELFMLLPYDDHKDVEGFGLVFLEAAASGLPVIGTRESGSEDAIADGKNGFLVPSGDSSAAARAAITILSQPKCRKEFSEYSKVFAARMNWERVAERYLDMYRELAGRQKGKIVLS